MKRATAVVGCVCLIGGLLGCGEKTPGESGVRKSDVPAWQGSSGASAYVAEGWKAGDQASWEQQLRNRSRGQNEYSRTDTR